MVEVFHPLSNFLATFSLNPRLSLLFITREGQEAVLVSLVNTIRDHKCTVGRLHTPADDDAGLLSRHQLSVSRPRHDGFHFTAAERASER